MKVSELIKIPEDYDPDLDVYVRQATDYRDDVIALPFLAVIDITLLL